VNANPGPRTEINNFEENETWDGFHKTTFELLTLIIWVEVLHHEGDKDFLS
jgi:hypothetical protein